MLALLKEVVEGVRLCPHLDSLHQLGPLGMGADLHREREDKKVDNV